MLKDYRCPYEFSVKHHANGVITVTEKDTHTAQCKAAAKAFKIPQTLDPKLLEWIKQCLHAEFTIDQIEHALFNLKFDAVSICWAVPRIAPARIAMSMHTFLGSVPIVIKTICSGYPVRLF